MINFSIRQNSNLSSNSEPNSNPNPTQNPISAQNSTPTPDLTHHLDPTPAISKIPEIESDPMSGWFDLPETFKDTDLNRIKSVAKRIQENSDFLVCIGIGGSYLGHRAIIEALAHKLTPKTKVLYAGNSLSQPAFQKVLDELADKDFSVNVISKSGTTTEPAIAFRIFKQKLIEKYGEAEAYKRIIATTDANKGALHDEAAHNHYETFIIPDNVGGRYSVLTAVGLLPLAVAGVDLDELFAGAREEAETTKSTYEKSQTSPKTDFEINNQAQTAPESASAIFRYAAARSALRDAGFDTEVLTSFEPNLFYLAEWWKQLFGESEGKGDDGIFPASTVYTTDLHSLGQYLQQGRKNLFETCITFKTQPVAKNATIKTVPELEENLDGLKYLENRDLSDINKQAELATITAHSEQRPVFTLELPDLSEKSLGALIYFFELTCAISAKLQGVNPFDQPGVERYKNEMFKLLGKE